MRVVECGVPDDSALSRAVIQAADFRDSYRAPLLRRELAIVEIFFALFGHAPAYMKLLLIARKAVASLAGLEAPTVAEIMNPDVKCTYTVGDKIGPWPIFAITDREIVAGRDNKHMDFRLSVLKQAEGDPASVTVSTICTVHNVYGRAYLFCIVPFHRFGVKDLIARAVAEGRL